MAKLYMTKNGFPVFLADINKKRDKMKNCINCKLWNDYACDDRGSEPCE